MAGFDAPAGGGVSVDLAEYSDLSASRAIDTLYTNDTGRPMHVFVDVAQDTNYDSNDRLSIAGRIWDGNDNFTVSRFDSGYGFADGDWDGYNTPVNMFVPDGGEYEVSNINTEAPVLNGWFEVTL